MGHIFQVELWVNIIVGITCGLVTTMDIGKGKEAINGILLWK